MKHLKPLQFMGLVSADTARLSKSSACAHKHRPPSPGTETHTEQTHHTLWERQGGEEVARENWISPSLCLFLSAYHPLFFFFFFFFSSGCLSFPGLSHPSILDAIQRLSCFPPLPQRAKPHQAGVRVESCHSKTVCLQIIYSIKGK